MRFCGGSKPRSLSGEAGSTTTGKSIYTLPVDRRSCFQLLSASALSAAFPGSIARALAIPANNKTGEAMQRSSSGPYHLEADRIAKTNGVVRGCCGETESRMEVQLLMR